ncbi:MAG: type II and III secretion system protein family protein [Tepidisphaeraceae bacterium]
MRTRDNTAAKSIIVFLSAALLLMPQTGVARPQAGAEPLVSGGVGADGRIHLTLNKSTVITTRRPQKRISIGEPSIVDVNGISPTRILLTAKKIGSTQVIVWDEQDQSQSIDVIVSADVSGLREQIDRLFPGNRMEVSTTEETIILSGRVPSLTVAQQAEALASPYGKKVVNLLEVAGGQQVMLHVRVAEVSRTAITALGVNYAYASGSFFGGSNLGQVNNTAFVPGEGSIVGATPTPQGLLLTADQAISPLVTIYGGGQVGNFFLEYFLTALRDNNLLRVLAEPNLTAISGEEASFLAGGEFPVPIPQGGSGINNTTITIEYKEFGIRLKFVPIVLGDGRIRLKLAPEVSDLDFTTAVRFSGFVVPGLKTRRVSTTIELANGQSFAIAGLMNQDVTAVKQVVPLLGDLPIIGAMFRSVRYQRRETELVVLCTARLVSPLNPNEVPPLPGENWRHPTEAELFFNQDLGSAMTTADAQNARKYFGNTGFAAPDAAASGDAATTEAPTTQPAQ